MQEVLYIKNSTVNLSVCVSPQMKLIAYWSWYVQKGNSTQGKDVLPSSGSSEKLSELVDPNLVLPSVLPFKRSQLTDRYPKGQTRGRHWKHLKQILQAENYHLYPADEPTCMCNSFLNLCIYSLVNRVLSNGIDCVAMPSDCLRLFGWQMSTSRLLLLCILQRNIVISQVLRYVSLCDLELLPRWKPFSHMVLSGLLSRFPVGWQCNKMNTPDQT